MTSAVGPISGLWVSPRSRPAAIRAQFCVDPVDEQMQCLLIALGIRLQQDREIAVIGSGIRRSNIRHKARSDEVAPLSHHITANPF